MRDRAFVRYLASASIVVIAACGLGGCASMGSRDVTGSISPTASRSDMPAAPKSDAEWRKSAEIYGERYRANPKDAEAALRYGQALRATGQHTQAAAVLEQATIVHPDDRALIGAYGRALSDTGSYQLAFDTLSRAHTPDNPDWSILSAQGAALDQLGKHAEARRYYASALKIRPDEPSVLSNLGMSYVLSKDLTNAERALRQAYGNARADARVRQNLALVVGLQGHFAEAETIVRADLPAEEATENVAYLKQMLNRSEDMRKPSGQAARTLGRSDASRS